MERLKWLFTNAVAAVRKRAPWMPKVKIRFCDLADRDHRKKWRQFAHSLHVPGYVCFARAAGNEMTNDEILGMSLHELGHIAAMKLQLSEHMKPVRGSATPKRVQDEADAVVTTIFNFRIRYNDRTLQEIVRP